MASKAKTIFKIAIQLTALILVAAGCSKAGILAEDGRTPPAPPSRVRGVAGQGGSAYLNFLEVGFNTPWKVAAIITFFNNNKGSLPAFADTPLSATSVRLYMGLAYTMASNGYTGDTATPRAVFAHINPAVGPVIGTAASNQNVTQVEAHLSHMCSRFWNRAPSPEELSDLKGLWSGLATRVAANSTGTREVAVRVAATIASSPQALIQVQ